MGHISYRLVLDMFVTLSVVTYRNGARGFGRLSLFSLRFPKLSGGLSADSRLGMWGTMYECSRYRNMIADFLTKKSYSHCFYCLRSLLVLWVDEIGDQV